MSPGVARLASLGQNHSLWAISSAPAKVASPGLRAPHLHCRHKLVANTGICEERPAGSGLPLPSRASTWSCAEGSGQPALCRRKGAG